MANNIHYERSNLKFINDIKYLQTRSLPERYEDDEWISVIDEECGFVALDGDRLVGVVVCTEMDDSFYVWCFVVDSDYRRKGIGQELMRQLYELKPKTKITLHVRATNKNARQFYKTQGFTEVKFFPNIYGEDEDGYFLHRLP